MKENSSLYENGDYWVCRGNHGYEVWKNTITHAVHCDTFYYIIEQALSKAVQACDRRAAGE